MLPHFHVKTPETPFLSNCYSSSVKCGTFATKDVKDINHLEKFAAHTTFGENHAYMNKIPQVLQDFKVTSNCMYYRRTH